ncbi:dipeptidyl peptidase III [Stipitochalara longipes BDJ]|nr:dipeptidyl peptidase III [Stipitochalara longipes BDJ]
MAASDVFVDINPPVYGFNIQQQFDGLNSKEKLYAHYMSKASFSGARIIMRQISPESESIFDLILALYKHCAGDFASLFRSYQSSEEDLAYFQDYAATFLSNLGNYRSSGDSKFIPRLSEDTIAKIAGVTPDIAQMWELVKNKIYSTDPRSLGYPSDGLLSGYYSRDISKEEIDGVQKFLDSKYIRSENTRLTKNTESGKVIYELLVASADPKLAEEYEIIGHDFAGGATLKIVYGDHSSDLNRVVHYLESAKKYAANHNQSSMLESYIESFRTGSIEAHKESQRYWVKDSSPSVETNMGFVESLRDPQGIRAEWDGLVAVVNKEKSKKFAEMVERSTEFIVKLPWNGVAAGFEAGRRGPFEAQKFVMPDYTSLEVLSFCTSEVWVGINLPNYDDIRETFGFKNVSLDNCMNTSSPTATFPFILDSEASDFRARRALEFDISTAIHELLGHGSGLLLAETDHGVYNFDHSNLPISPLDRKPISSWYSVGQTFSSVFGRISGCYSECHAELTALFLADDKEIMRLFGCSEAPGHTGFDEILYTSYLDMANMGLGSITAYDSELKQWGQAHARARFAILRCLLSAPDDLLTLKHTLPDMSDLKLHLDKTKILSHGKPAVSSFLQKLHIYRSTADVENGTALMETMTEVDEYFLKIREVVWQKRQPRRLFVQPNTKIVDGEVVLVEYDGSCAGVIRSWAEREL